MQTVTIPDWVKEEPGYLEGFDHAKREQPFDTNRGDDEPYAYGFEAGDRARHIIRGLSA